MAIEFEALKQKAVTAIEKFKSTGLDISKYENILNNIIEDSTKRSEIPNNITNTQVAYSTNEITKNYTELIAKIKELLRDLKQYEIYYRAVAFCKFTNSFINRKDKKPDEFAVYGNGLYTIIEGLLSSNTLAYEKEEKIIEETYKTAYLFIKEEIIYLNKSNFLDYLLGNSISLSFLEKQINEELKSIDLKNPKYARLCVLKEKIDSQGINSTYATQEFLKALVMASYSDKKIKSNIVEELSDVTKVREEASTVVKNHNEIIGKLKINKNEKEYIYKIALQNFVLFITSAGMLITFFATGISSARAFGRKYKTTISRYSISNGLTKKVEYGKLHESTVIYETSPYKKPVFSGNPYKRDVYSYDVSSLDMESIEDIYELNLSEIDVKGEKTVERKSHLSLDDTYDDIIKYVERIEVDKSDYKDELSLGVLLAFLVAAAAMDLMFISKYQKKTERLGVPLYISVKGLIKNIKEIKSVNKKSIENESDLEKIRYQVDDILVKYKKYIKQLMNLYDFIKENPEFVEEKEQIEKEIILSRQIIID